MRSSLIGSHGAFYGRSTYTQIECDIQKCHQAKRHALAKKILFFFDLSRQKRETLILFQVYPNSYSSSDRFFYYLNMGNDMSSHASSVSDASTVTGSSKEQQPFGVRGRNNTTNRESSGDKSSSPLMIQPTDESCDFTELDMIDSSDDLSYYENDQSDMLSEDEYDSDEDDEGKRRSQFICLRKYLFFHVQFYVILVLNAFYSYLFFFCFLYYY
jgi:hypothetical protein